MAHYLVDLHNAILANSALIDVRDPTNFQSLTNGCFVVRVPDGVQVVRPSSFSNLITQKYTGLLAFYAGFTRITFDDLVNASGIDAANSSGITLGERGSISLFPGGVLQSNVIGLTPGAPPAVIVTWETFQYTASDAKTDRYQRTYAEVASSPLNITCSVSCDGGVTFNSALDGGVTNIPGLGQGTNFIIRLTNASANRLWLGSWAVIY
jgi:hypothetical protein